MVGSLNPSGRNIKSKGLSHLSKGEVDFPLNVAMSGVETLADVLSTFEINDIQMRTSVEISLS